MRGWSGSGKSTKAREIANQAGAVVICRDDLRMMLLGSYWTGKQNDEDRVTVAEEAQVTSLLGAGHNVVVDATHLHPPYLRKWAKLATRIGADFEVVDVITDIDECKRRDHVRMLAGVRHVGASVIDQQVKRFPMHKWPAVTAVKPIAIEPYEYPNPGPLPVAIIVDIDGTLAHMNGRSPYDYTKVLEDDLDQTIAVILDDWKYVHPRGEILIVSGRDHTCRRDTLAWLNKNDVQYDKLFMRNADLKDGRGNKIPDWIVKYGIFNDHIRYDYDVHFVLDDRDQVVRMWRKLGLKCLQVQEGDF
jgi:predicted kinase